MTHVVAQCQALNACDGRAIMVIQLHMHVVIQRSYNSCHCITHHNLPRHLPRRHPPPASLSHLSHIFSPTRVRPTLLRAARAAAEHSPRESDTTAPELGSGTVAAPCLPLPQDAGAGAHGGASRTMPHDRDRVRCRNWQQYPLRQSLLRRQTTSRTRRPMSGRTLPPSVPSVRGGTTQLWRALRQPTQQTSGPTLRLHTM
jgi:hypothetical protein